MKMLNVVALILAVVGLVILILDWMTAFGESSGYLVMGIGFPILILGIIVWVVGLFIKKK